MNAITAVDIFSSELSSYASLIITMYIR